MTGLVRSSPTGRSFWARGHRDSHLLFPAPTSSPLGDFTQYRGCSRALGLSRSPSFRIPLNPETSHPLIHALLGRKNLPLKNSKEATTHAGDHCDAR